MRIFLRVLVVMVLVYAVLSIVRSLFASYSAAPARRTTPPAQSGKLVKDPVCGMYVAQESAFQAGGEFFCSEECQQKFLAKG
jgi:hypothetical protein